MQHSYKLGLVVGLSAALLGCIIQLLTRAGIFLPIWVFPLNILLSIFIILCAIVLRINFHATVLYKRLLNPLFSAGIITVVVLLTMLMGLITHHRVNEGSSDSLISSFSSIVFSITNSWPFIATLLLMMLVLCVVMFGRKPRLNLRYISFQLNHMGLFLLMLAGVMGAPDKLEYRAILSENFSTNSVYSIDGKKTILPFELSLDHFNIEYFQNKLAVIEFDTLNGQIMNKTQYDLSSQVRQYKIDGYHVAIESIDFHTDTLIVDIDEGKWLLHVDYSRGFAPLAPGKALILTKGGVRQYMAILSARHNEACDKSVVLVNHPWKYKGYYIYLEDYNPKRGVVLRLSVDHWFRLAHVGLWMLIIGALLMFYKGPIGFVYITERKGKKDFESTNNLS